MTVKFTHKPLKGKACGSRLEASLDVVGSTGGRASRTVWWCPRCKRVVQVNEVQEEKQP